VGQDELLAAWIAIKQGTEGVRFSSLLSRWTARTSTRRSTSTALSHGSNASVRACGAELVFPELKTTGYLFMGNSVVAWPDGPPIARTRSVAPVVVRVEVDTNKMTRARFALPLLKDLRVELYGDLSKRWEVQTVPS
jgi:hypothetical protein